MLWVFLFCFLIDSHVPYGCGLSCLFLEPWLENFSRSLGTTWVELLVVEALVRNTFDPFMSLLTSPRSLGWKNSLKLCNKLWVELLVLELSSNKCYRAMENIGINRSSDG